MQVTDGFLKLLFQLFVVDERTQSTFTRCHIITDSAEITCHVVSGSQNLFKGSWLYCINDVCNIAYDIINRRRLLYPELGAFRNPFPFR